MKIIFFGYAYRVLGFFYGLDTSVWRTEIPYRITLHPELCLMMSPLEQHLRILLFSDGNRGGAVTTFYSAP